MMQNLAGPDEVNKSAGLFDGRVDLVKVNGRGAKIWVIYLHRRTLLYLLSSGKRLIFAIHHTVESGYQVILFVGNQNIVGA